jgi:hypothetical protein
MGKLMAKYSVAFDTMKKLSAIGANWSQAQVVRCCDVQDGEL